jgi:hypothetical protein
MAIRQKRSLTSGSIPTTSSLQAGELAINVPDGRLFFRKSGSGSDTIQSAITTGAQNSGSVSLTGSLSLFGTGSVFSVSGDVFEISGDLIEFTGSFIVTGSARVTGSLSVTNGITGSLQGTSSWAVSASQAITASYVLQAVSASNAGLLDGLDSTVFATTGSNIFRGNQTITGSFNITGSLTVVGAVSASNFTGSLLGTASFATSASWAPGGGGASFPYTGSAVITGSLVVTGSFDLGIAEFNSTSSATTAGTTIVSSYATASANSAFYNYYISSGSNARAGQIMSVWSGSTIQYTEVTTNDLGNTNTASFAVTLATGSVRLSFTAPGVWTVRSIVNLL